MESGWTVARFSAVMDLDSRRVAKALALLDAAQHKSRDVWPMAEGIQAILAEQYGLPPPLGLDDAGAYWQLRHGVNLARDALDSIDASDATRKRLAQHVTALWSEIIKLEARYDVPPAA